VFTPKPCIILKDRGIARSDMAHMTMWVASHERVNKTEGSPKRKKYFTFRLQTNKVPKIVVRRLTLRYLVMRLGFDGMNKIRELDRFLYEENGEIIPDDIPISFFGVKLGGKAAHVSDGVLRQKHH
jgi:hypothetical protein